jgi:CubicO group peptidase (beta-lactamase class C family)
MAPTRAPSTSLSTSGDVALSFEPLRSYIESRIEEGLIPGAVVAVGRRSLFHQAALGRRAVAPRVEPMALRTIFDLASLTKPMVTGALAAELACAGVLDLDDPVERHLEETRGTDAGSLPLRMLLTHTAGFPAMNPVADYSGGKPRLFAAIAREPLEASPGQRFTYSDVGYIVMQGVLERVTRKRLDRLAREMIFVPLGFRDTRFGTRAADLVRVAPTTRLHDDRGPWLRGRVHDPRARSRALGGIAGHAGVFGTAEEAARFCAMILHGGLAGPRRILRSEAVRLMTTNQAGPQVSVRRGIGFDIDSPYSAPRGSLFSSDSFGHTGFTGVSLWIDPRHDAYFVLLTNSLHAGGHKDLKAFRSEAATLAARGLGIGA